MRLEVKDLHVHYGKIEAIKGVSIVVNEGEIVTLIGANGAGKTTMLKTISGLRPVSSGQILFDGKDISKMPAHERVDLGLSQAPEGRGIFPGMTVLENLEMGKFNRKDAKAEMAEDLDRVYTLFPRLKERASQAGGTLSGGEQQMLAIGRALMARPKVLLLDEPSMGLAPQMIANIFRIITEINKLNPSFSIFIGDTKSGSTPCSDEYNFKVKEYFNQYTAPLIYSIGDNEWTDCHRPLAGSYDPLERLDNLRNSFFNSSQSFGKKQLQLTRQGDVDPTFKKFVENAYWVKNQILFVNLHVTGSNNNFERDES